MTFIEFLLLYLLGQANNFSAFFGIITAFLAAGALGVIIFNTTEGRPLPKMAYGLIGFAMFTGLIGTAFPKQETVAILLAGGLTLEIARSESVQSVAKNGLAVIDQELKKYLDKPTEDKNAKTSK